MPRKVVIINRKGGCGKTTISTNLAGYYAARGELAAIHDFDPQDSSVRWVSQREQGPGGLQPIHGVAASHPPKGATTRAFQLRVPRETRCLVVDTPASLRKMDLIEILRGADAILIPVLPSSIDLFVTGAFIEDLRNMAHLYAPQAEIAVVANRVRRNTRAFQALQSYLHELGMPPVACLRDTQNYVIAAQNGTSIHEMAGSHTRKDRQDWQPLIEWLETPSPVAA